MKCPKKYLFSATISAAPDSACPPKLSTDRAVSADVSRQYHRRRQWPERHPERASLGPKELHRARQRHLRLLSWQGRWVVIFWGIDHLRFEKEWRWLVGRGHERSDRPLSWQLCRSYFVNWNWFINANPVNFVLVWVPVTRDKVVKVQESLPNRLIKQ